MVARVGSLEVGTRIVTTLTGRGGRVLAHMPGHGFAVMVLFEDDESKWLHPAVRVKVVEVTH